jgi:hypothetical protein
LCATTSGLLVTLGSFPALANCVRPVGQLAGVGAALEACALVSSELPFNSRVPDVLNDLEFSNFLLLPSMLALLASGALFFTRLLSNQASRARFQPLGAVQSVFLLFRRQHRLFGWMGLAFAAAHSAYFLLFPGQLFVQWTGIAATALLGALGLLGLVTSYQTRLRLWTHRILAIGLIGALGLHWLPFLPAASALLVLVCAAGWVHLKLIAGFLRALAASQ